MLNEINYWLIPMNFNNCNYKQLEDEWKKNKKIMWQVGGKPKYTKTRGYEVPNGSMAKSINKGDVIYFYVTNLPSESKNKLSRIMLRGVVEDEPYPIEKSKVYIRTYDSDMIIGFSIGSITTLCEKQLHNNVFLSLEYLKKQYANFQYPQGRTRWPDRNIKQTLSKELIDDLEECFKSRLSKNDFTTLIDHFKKKCFFCGKYGSNIEHKTFVAKNGLDYYECHHFIQQNEGRKDNRLLDIVNSTENGLFLCSNCHNRLHYGQPDDVKEMLKIVLKDEKIQSMLEDKNFQQIIGEDKDILEWLKESYKV